MKRAWLVVGIVLLAACKKEEGPSTAGSGAASASAAPSGATALTALTAPADSASAAVGDIAPTEDPDKLPAPAASQATKDISPTNYKKELDSVEKELNAIK
ncbi:MAG TPA: hypothetical protein VLM85_10110 [Polyangiaceae bacterium]|nr:hypothetical protein [Polyangiaceae bacterium]